jgi:OPA family sugar phosphate sensor protein UhpC-like MFS transporter
MHSESSLVFGQERAAFRRPPSSSPSILKPTAMKTLAAATIAYSLYYSCRLSLSVVKGPIIGEGLLSEFQLGMIGSALFYGYAIGKLFNGFLADRVDIRKFAATGLLISAIINLFLGFYSGFAIFFALWLINGWVQSMGACSFIIGITRWFAPKERGTYYGLWSASHNLGEGMTFLFTGLMVSSMGWRLGWCFSSALGLAGVAIIWLFFRDKPAQPVLAARGEPEMAEEADPRVAQRQLLKDPAIWLIALASMTMYISRYSINSWGIFFLEKAKNYSIAEASMIISISSVCGIIGTVGSGWVSDRFFRGDRGLPTILAGAVNALSLAAFVYGPKTISLDIGSMICFGVSIGALICYLGGLMAVDIAGKGATGAALGIVGMASYLGAGTQDLVSGYLLGANKVGSGSVATYNFLPLGLFWVTAACLSIVLSAIAWNLHRRRRLAHQLTLPPLATSAASGLALND